MPPCITLKEDRYKRDVAFSGSGRWGEKLAYGRKKAQGTRGRKGGAAGGSADLPGSFPQSLCSRPFSGNVTDRHGQLALERMGYSYTPCRSSHRPNID